MTVADFTRKMDALCSIRDNETVKREGMKLIMTELGNGVPGYLNALQGFMVRLHNGDNGIGGTDGSQY